MIKPMQRDDVLLADVERAKEDAEALHLWWLGQSGYLIQWQGRHLLLDPYLSDSLTLKYAATPKPHVRMTELVVAPDRLDFVDVVTSSHNHTDHLDGETLIALLTANPTLTVVVPEANRPFAAERLQVDSARLTGIVCGRPETVSAFEFNAVPAAHEEIETDDQGRHKFIGLVVRFGPWTIYHSGDTIRYEGMVEHLSQWPIDLALLPINGHDPARAVAGNLSGEEAARLAKEAGVGLVIPCHYDMFEFNTASPDDFEAACRREGQSFRTLKCGERLRLPSRKSPD
ncbi:MAG: MBL fold metallo-hydrolase [Planctomycetes bacterium]|nr:MBL fold metallo-hydrolase [Planctomycetota bacterium]